VHFTAHLTGLPSLVVSNNKDCKAGQSFTLTTGSGAAYVKILAGKDGK
jgi:hypothetical protein